MVSRAVLDLDQARAIVEHVVDPEIPVLTIADLGVLRRVGAEDGRVVVVITPTYSGCPAMRQIEDDITHALDLAGYPAEVRIEHNPPWSSEWVTEEGRRKLADFGIAPPTALGDVICPRCDKGEPRMISLFGSTACKALMVCSSCGEPFTYFKRY